MRRLCLVSILAALAVTPTLFAAVAGAQLDRSFGQNGVVRVKPPLQAPWQSQSISQLAAGRDGSSYALFRRYPCKVGFPECASTGMLFRYGDHGTLDRAFAKSGSYEVPDESDERLGHVHGLAVDSAGRPLVVQVAGSRVSVRRLTRSGAVDAGFGDKGVASFECGCARDEAHLFPGPRGSVIVSFSHLFFEPGEQDRTIGTFVRLRADGSVDTSFGHAGRAVVRASGGEDLVVSAVSRKGDVYLTRMNCCGGELPAVIRLSASGAVDRRFIGATDRALRPIRKRGRLDWAVTTALLRSDGGLDLLGEVSFDHGFILRLNRAGHPVRSFGNAGLQITGHHITSAVRGSNGATIAVSEDAVEGNNFVLRILGDGKLDRAFGARRIPDSHGDLGFSVVSQTRRRAMVLDLGEFECREACVPEPKLIRYLEGPARKRR